MPTPTSPFDIAREALRQLAVQRIPPTPDNYLKLYNEIAGVATEENEFPVRFVRQIARWLPRDTVEQQRLARLLEQTLTNSDATTGQQVLEQYISSLHPEAPPAWNDLIGQLLRQWEGRQLGWTAARKRESLDRVLSANDQATLYARLQGLLRAWSQAPANPELPAPATETSDSFSSEPERNSPAPTDTTTVRLVAAEATELLHDLRELLLLALESVVPSFLGAHPELTHDATLIASSVRQAASVRALVPIHKQLGKFALRLGTTADDDAEIRSGLLSLLRLILDNIDELVIDDQWLHGQVEMLRDVVTQPASVRMIDDAERRLKELIYKQSQLKHNLTEAQHNLRTMLAGFVDQLARFAASTGAYHDRIDVCAQKIAAAHDITEIGPLLDQVMNDTRSIQMEAARSHGELQHARERAQTAEAKIAALQTELEQASRLIRHDQLTGTLNRRGLEEIAAKERARATRRDAPLCVALLDIDNFKHLNDTLGHQAGDDALRHLTNIVRQYLRPQDSLARYGGEEFVILLPETDLEQARQTLVRLQRELTRELFMSGAVHLVITFSAGVTPWDADESLEAVVVRADAAMYQAKQAGKNRVVTQASPGSASV